ncbi:MAG: fatty acid desaturase family protein [Acidimicrobiia bacterium]
MATTQRTATGSMIPEPALLVAPSPESRLTEIAKPVPEWREQLRRIPSWRNALSVVVLYAMTVGIIALAVWVNHPVVWVLAFLAMGPVIARFNILMHEAAHRLLFANRRVNDFVGRWFLGFPVFAPIDLYRRGHMAHHREEFGPNEPDIPLYRGYPIPRDSMRRKLTRDALGITGTKLMRGLFRGLRAPDAAIKKQAWSILATQVVILGLFTVAGHPWLYLFLWLLPDLTVWRVMNRLRSIAEHGGMQASSDRRNTTHSVRQSWPARLTIVPYNTGWHLSHHVDSGIPFRKLPVYHAELIRSGYVQPPLEYPTYRALWRKLASG